MSGGTHLLLWILTMMGLIFIDYSLKKEFRKINKKLDDLANK